MGNNMEKARGRGFLAIPAGILFVACLPGCVSGGSTDGGFLKKAANMTAVAAVEIASPSKIGTIRNAWQDGGGIWHWTRVEQGVGTFQCEGSELGTPQQCEQVSRQW
jgi:hypothetical protein